MAITRNYNRQAGLLNSPVISNDPVAQVSQQSQPAPMTYDQYIATRGNGFSPEMIEAQGDAIPGVFEKQADRNLINSLYEDVASGKVTLTPGEFTHLIQPNSDTKGLDANEWSLYSPEMQTWAKNNPQAFVADLLAHRNAANGDLASVGAEGGYENLGAITPPSESNKPVNYANAGYKPINDDGFMSLIFDDVLGFDPNGGGMWDFSRKLLPGDDGDKLFGMDPNGGGIVKAGNAIAPLVAAYFLGPLVSSAIQGATGVSQASMLAAQEAGFSAAELAGYGGATQVTGGALVGNTGLLGSTGNAVGDAVLNGAVRGSVTNAVTGRDPLTGALTGGITGGMGTVDISPTGNAIVDNSLRGGLTGALTGAVNGDAATGAITGATGGAIRTTIPGVAGGVVSGYVNTAINSSLNTPTPRAIDTSQPITPQQTIIVPNIASNRTVGTGVNTIRNRSA